MAWKKGNEEKHLELIVHSTVFKVGVKCLKEVESATVVYVGRGEEIIDEMRREDTRRCEKIREREEKSRDGAGRDETGI